MRENDAVRDRIADSGRRIPGALAARLGDTRYRSDENDQVEPASSSEGQEAQFTGHCERRVLPGIGHCPPAEDPDATVRAIDDALSVS